MFCRYFEIVLIDQGSTTSAEDNTDGERNEHESGNTRAVVFAALKDDREPEKC